MNIRAFIVGCVGLRLNEDERAFFRASRPWGLILFKRNIDNPTQVAALTSEFRSVVGYDAAVLVDQEGGRVQRLSPPNWRAYPAGAAYAQARSGVEASDLARLGARLIAHDLKSLGIDVDCLPVLDTPVEGAHNIIGDRAYAKDALSVARLGRAAAQGLLAGGVLPVMKHIPGHGRALADSHLELPIVRASRAELEAHDFAPFKANRDLPAAMSAHVVYTALDPERPATHSPYVVREIIRGHIGFDGLLMSDDLSMKALGGSFFDRARKLFAAGLDLALHCNGDLGEATAVAEASPVLSGAALARAERAKAAIRAPEPFDPVEAAALLQSALAISA